MPSDTVGNSEFWTWMVHWCCSRGFRSSIQEVSTEDAGQHMACLDVLVLHLGSILTEVQMPRHLSHRDGTEEGVKEPDQGACSSRTQTPAHASQEQATAQKR